MWNFTRNTTSRPILISSFVVCCRCFALENLLAHRLALSSHFCTSLLSISLLLFPTEFLSYHLYTSLLYFSIYLLWRQVLRYTIHLWTAFVPLSRITVSLSRLHRAFEIFGFWVDLQNVGDPLRTVHADLRHCSDSRVERTPNWRDPECLENHSSSLYQCQAGNKIYGYGRKTVIWKAMKSNQYNCFWPFWR